MLEVPVCPVRLTDGPPKPGARRGGCGFGLCPEGDSRTRECSCSLTRPVQGQRDTLQRSFQWRKKKHKTQKKKTKTKHK